MEECKTLIANQPLTSDLAFDIYQIACYLNERRQENCETYAELAKGEVDCVAAVTDDIVDKIYKIEDKKEN